MIIDKFKPFKGQHCETTATGSLLMQLSIEFSEPMLFGLGEGLGFIFWNMKTMDFPFIGGRVKPDVLTENIARHLNLNLEVKETSTKQKAWENVIQKIDRGIAVGLKLDCYHLDYFSIKFHFAGHYVAMYGYDDEFAFLVDTDQQGGKVKTTLRNLELARNETGPMSSRNLMYSIGNSEKGYDLYKEVKKAINRNAKVYLNPPINNFGYKGVLKTGTEIKKWFRNSKDIKGEFQTCARLMERGGTGGALFRNLYRDFLKESYDLMNIEAFRVGYDQFSEIAEMWTEVSSLFDKTGETQHIEYIDQASKVLKALSEKESKAMETLEQATS